jgi:uncharacterized protein (DUF885 family)
VAGSGGVACPGYYQPPAGTGAGYYHYNTSDLPGRPLLQTASVIYHEGLPGHHLQMSPLAENSALHPIRREQTGLRTFALNGYLGGWAEYAAGLCELRGTQDMRQFHDAVLASGPLPLRLLRASPEAGPPPPRRDR